MQYLARLLAIVGIVVLPERMEQLSGTAAEQAAAAGERAAPLGSLEQPRGRMRAVDRPPRPEEGAPLDEVSWLYQDEMRSGTGCAPYRLTLIGFVLSAPRPEEGGRAGRAALPAARWPLAPARHGCLRMPHNVFQTLR